MELVKADDSILHKVCRPDFVLQRQKIERMFSLMRELGGVALATPQVGIDAALCD